jgi:tetratricopeptide (TPR) repeat protein
MSILAMAFLAATGANAFHDTFDRAHAAYAEERYADSVSGFEQLVGEQVHDPAVFYNLGNAYFRLGELGLAIANYERALQLAPGMADAEGNLARAVRGAERQLPRPRGPGWEQALFFWHAGLAPAQARLLAVIVWISFWSLLALRTWRRFPYARSLIAAAGIAMLLTTASAWLKSNPPAIAVVIDPVVQVRHGTSEEEGVRFELYQGDRVLLEELRGGWARVQVVTGDSTDRGWTPAPGIVAVGPPYRPTPSTRLDRFAVDAPPDAG